MEKMYLFILSVAVGGMIVLSGVIVALCKRHAHALREKDRGIIRQLREKDRLAKELDDLRSEKAAMEKLIQSDFEHHVWTANPASRRLKKYFCRRKCFYLLFAA
jgi:predicted Zn-dependent protease